jgi:hypothetical protein
LDQPSPPASRRAWVTIGEIVGVLALVVAGLSFWDSHQERLRADQDRAVAARQAASRAYFLLRADLQGGGDRLGLEPVRAGQVIQSQLLVFPTWAKTADVRTTGDARIEAGWIAGAARAAARKIKADDGDRRLPVGVATSYLEDGQAASDQSIYWLGYSLHGRLLLPPRVELEGLSLAKRGVSGDLKARLDAMEP